MIAQTLVFLLLSASTCLDENLKETYCPAAIQPSQDRLGSNIAGIFSSSPSCFVFSYTPEEQKIYWGKRKIVNLITEQTTNSPDRIPHN